MVNVLSVVNDDEYKNKFLDALYDIRTSLAIKRIISKTILVSKFKELLDTVKSNYDEKVSKALDDVFEEFLPVNKKNTKETNLSKDNSDLDNKVSKSNEYSDNGFGKNGASLVMAKKGFKSDNTNIGE